jgi:extradiol dioxygenase family protein
MVTGMPAAATPPDSEPRPPFHLAFPVADLAATRAFYGELLGCREARSAPTWVDFDFYGHQISAHLCPAETGAVRGNAVDGDQVPVRHFGAVLPLPEWERLAARLEAAGARFLIAPRIRFAGEIGEQATFFLLDPAGNALEFKAFRDPSKLFASTSPLPGT